MKAVALVIPWTIILLAVAIGVTSWVWMASVDQTNADWADYNARNNAAWKADQTDRINTQANLEAEITARNARIARDNANWQAEKQRADLAIRQRDEVIAADKRTITQRDQTIAQLRQTIRNRDSQIAKANRNLTQANQTIASQKQAIRDRDAEIAKANRAIRNQRQPTIQVKTVSDPANTTTIRQLRAQLSNAGAEYETLRVKYNNLVDQYNTLNTNYKTLYSEATQLAQAVEQWRQENRRRQQSQAEAQLARTFLSLGCLFIAGMPC